MCKATTMNSSRVHVERKATALHDDIFTILWQSGVAALGTCTSCTHLRQPLQAPHERTELSE